MPPRLLTGTILGILTLLPTLAVGAQLEEENDFQVGLIGRYYDDEGQSIERIDSRVSFVWNDDSPDPRVGAQSFKAVWTGYLMSQARGKYALSVYGAGKVRIKLGGKVILDEASDKPSWMHAEAVELPFDWHPLEVQFEKPAETARLSLFWKGPGFQFEPIGERWLYHDREQTPSESFQSSEMLVRALRCGACHDMPGQAKALPAPALDRLAGNISSKWLVDWLSHEAAEVGATNVTKNDSDSSGRRMPHFGLSPEDAESIAKYLFSQSEAAVEAKPQKKRGKSEKPDPRKGKELLMTSGCLACHQLGSLGTAGLFDGGDLSAIADKRPKEFFARWLNAPETLNRHHRMPVFSMSAEELNHLTAFLATCKRSDTTDFTATRLAENDPMVEQGRQLVARHRCTACHELSDDSLPAAETNRRSLAGKVDWNRSCVAEAGQRESQPRYSLDQSSRDDIRDYFDSANRLPREKTNVVSAKQLLAENNCLSCHARGLGRGILPQVLEVAKSQPQLDSVVPAMIPPSLNSVGDKLHVEALADTIARKGDAHRPWLRVRMPNFSLSPSELERLVNYFVAADRIPDRGDRPKTAELDEAELHIAGARLVTSAGFGCTSCHRVGDVEPPQAPLNTRGPDLSQLGKRIRRGWYDRWVRDPARIVPKMEMPSVQLPVRGVLNDRLDQQLDAVWHALNQPGFQPPTPNPVRVVRRSGLSNRHEPAAVLTDVIQSQGQTFVKPFVAGLPNRHSVMIDLATNRLAGWWIGDVARQRTKGKTWFWEGGGTELLQAAPGETDLTLVFEGEEVRPHREGQFITEADQWRQITGGTELDHRLHFQLPAEASRRTATVHVTQRFQQLARESQSSGLLRTVTLRGIPADASPKFHVVDASKIAKNSIANDRRSVSLSSRSRIEIERPESATFTDTGAIRFSPLSRGGKLELALRYKTTLPVDRFPVEPPQIPAPPTIQLSVVPGFEATRLPIADQWMPTGLAWRPDGTLVVTSLKGRVWIARDSDGDGLEDRVAQFSDELAAPFGAAAGQNYVDVINKYALLRLFDEDGDGRADRTRTLASGWGHTTDYHDWAVGLPKDKSGNYYVALACQQDNRSEAAARLRGKVVVLKPRTPTADDPRVFAIKQISGGHRFPTGIARRRDGAVFVTDNQGNYNPFNELNHVRQGARYGFINKLERKEGFAPPLTRPAINIPHPWTRSVNGICFLDTPQSVTAQSGRDVFGPFEGHLIGCEYDTRRLIRMSLQKVGDTYQGAAYPFSFDTPPEGDSLRGPLTCAVAPDGDLYIGSIRDSGWGGANNIGSLVRLKPTLADLPAGIAEVRAVRDGFEIEFTVPVDTERAGRKSNYSVASYTRVSTPAYGGSDKNRRVENIRRAEVLDRGRAVRLEFDELRSRHVYEFRIKNLARDKGLFFPDKAFYTLNEFVR